VTVGIIADDLTGAGDSAVQFAGAGWQVSLALTESVAVTPGGVIAIVTDARAQPFEAARLATESAVATVRAAGIDRLFVKIDSTMRGSVDAQIRGALTAWTEAQGEAETGAEQRPFAIVCPAYPGMGRTLQVGRVLVNGVAVELTSVGRDPVTPVNTALVSALIPGSMNLAVGEDDAATVAKRIAALVAAGIEIVTVDATTDAELELIAEATVLLGPAAIPVGSAGLAMAMSKVWAGATEATVPTEATVVPTGDESTGTRRAADRILVVVSSLHDVSREQHAHLVTVDLAERVRTLAPTLEDLADEASTATWLSAEFVRSRDLPRVVVILSPAERGDLAVIEANETEANQAHANPTTAIRVAAGLAELTASVLHEAAISALVLMGGEGARAVLGRVGAEAIRVTGAIREGIPAGVIEGGLLDGLAVVTKAGGFGDRGTLADLIPELLAQAQSKNKPTHPNRSQGAQS
jgi:uncharacterized protein YgbK (DUF1537 family)